MKLEDGKYYRGEDGKKYGPMRNYDGYGRAFDLSDDTFGHWDSNGNGYRNNPNLIAPWPADVGTLAEIGAQPGPVITETVTKKRIVTGDFDGLSVARFDPATSDHGANVCIKIDGGFSAPQLRALCSKMTEIAEAME